MASIVDRATAKETRNRYLTIAEMVHDLEQALAVEAARAGQATDEATTVIRALPAGTPAAVASALPAPRHGAHADAHRRGGRGGGADRRRHPPLAAAHRRRARRLRRAPGR